MSSRWHQSNVFLFCWMKENGLEIIKTNCPLCTIPRLLCQSGCNCGYLLSQCWATSVCGCGHVLQCRDKERERNFFLFDRYATFNSRSASVLVLHSKRTNTSYSRDSLISFMRENERYSSWFFSSLSRIFTSQISQMVMHGASGTEKAHVDTSGLSPLDLQFLPCTNKTRSFHLLQLKQHPNLGTRIPLRLFQELLGSSKFSTEKDNSFSSENVKF